MNFGRANISSPPAPVIPDEYYALGARYADRRGRAGSMASLNAPVIASFRQNTSSSRVLYPATARLSGGLLANLIRSPELDLGYVQRFQHIAVIAQLADAIISVAQATGKCIVPAESDSAATVVGKGDEKSQNENSTSNDAQESQHGLEGMGKGKGKEKIAEQGTKSDSYNNLQPANEESVVNGAKYQEVSQAAGNTIEESA